MKKILTHALCSAVLLAAAAAQAQAPAPAKPSSPAKKELIARVLKAQQPAIEGVARELAEEPAIQLMNRAGLALQARVAPEQRETVGNAIQGDLNKYVETAVPMVQARAVVLAPSTIGAVLEQEFTEDELRQLIAIIESPVHNRFQSLVGKMQENLSVKLVADTRASIEPMVRTLEDTIAKRLGVPPLAGGAAAPAAAAAPAKPAATRAAPKAAASAK